MIKLKKAPRDFIFHTIMRLHEATGRRARNLSELLEGIRESDGSVIFHHTYGSLLRYHFMVPAPVSDFAFWVEHMVHDELMAEKLSGIDTINYATINDIRQAHIKLLEEHLVNNGRGKDTKLEDAFYFVRGNSYILPTLHVAQDLASFMDCINRVSNNSLYFHLFESRLRLEQETNDFSFWLGENLEEEELAQFMARQDPYVQTLDNIRASILEALGDRLVRLKGEM